uniref:Uncharacterized protein n=1 Tax=Anopheles stephensi TaxID=30069 RepID=A0A182YR89_ANOST
MLCSFRSYRSKVQQSMHTGAAYDEVYRPRWFAYEAMMFMANATEDNDHADTNKWNISPLTNLKIIKKSTAPWTDPPDQNDQRVITRLRIGHTRLTHTHRLKKESPLICSLCGVDLTIVVP